MLPRYHALPNFWQICKGQPPIRGARLGSTNSALTSCRLNSGLSALGSHLHKDEEWLGDAEQREKHFEEECERVLMETYAFLNKVQDFLPQVGVLLLLPQKH